MFTTKKQAPTPPQQYRQGDVLLTRIESALPAGATAVQRDRGRVILAYGEVTGHAHAIAATIAATRAATRDATSAATSAATIDATIDATRVAWNPESWYGCPVPALIALAREFFANDWQQALECCWYADWMWDGGNQWSWWSAYMSFFRHVVKLGESHGVDYSKWQHYEAASVHGGPRIMHKEFCIISDRPEVLLVDARNRPHCETGPFCRWRDGTALYAWHGTRIPMWIIEQPERLTPKRISEEENAEIRRVMLERYGTERYLRDLGAKRVQADDYGTLYRVELQGDEPLVMVEVENSTPEPDGTNKMYMIRVPPTMTTAREAVAWTFGLERASDYAPVQES